MYDNTLAAVYGAKGQGKTTLTVTTACELALSRRVLYITTEESFSDLEPKIYAWANQHQTDINTIKENLMLTDKKAIGEHVGSSFDIRKAEHYEWLSKTIRNKYIEAVIIDTISGATEADLTEKVFAPILERLLELTRKDVLVLYTHHSGKNPNAGMKGTSRLEQKSVTVIELSIKGKNTVQAYYEFQRYGEEKYSVYFKRHTTEINEYGDTAPALEFLGRNRDSLKNEPETSPENAVLNYLRTHKQASRKELMDLLDVSRPDRVIAEMRERGQITKGSGKFDPYTLAG